MSMPDGSVEPTTAAGYPPVEVGLEVDAADLFEQRTYAAPETVDDPEQPIPLRPPELDRASEIDAADSLVEIPLDEENWDA